MGMRERDESVDVLLIESDPEDANRITEAFAQTYPEATTHVVGDKEDAVEFIHRHGEHADAPPPNLILLDLHLPEEDAIELLRTLKGDPKLRRQPVLVLVAEDTEEVAERTYDLSANAYIPKPDDPDQYDRLSTRSQISGL
ncbi:response regulator [Natrinema sp. SYSU A 869]|uniref:response regulator n=1 Tax=Natrinema sp. SYSU A 869 TaxID=2871694 RepID=UPI001CA3F0BC|nr:response regulator [Natrinema sp. SYSU A 869]